MSARYWTTVVPVTRRQMRHWHRQAQEIPDPALRELALRKLAEERFNVQTAPTFATLAPPMHRSCSVEAIVSLQITYDYLDGLAEQPVSAPLRNGQELFRALTDAVSSLRPPNRNYYRYSSRCEDGGYLSQLVASTQSTLSKLPASAAVGEVVRAAASRCAEAQARVHAVPSEGTEPIEGWAIAETSDTETPWQETLASAASGVISIHALIAAAANPRTTSGQAARIEAFHRSTGALATILDGLADRARDERSGEDQLGYLRYFPDLDVLGAQLVHFARRAIEEADGVLDGAHHLMTLAGVVAYYTSALGPGESSSKRIVAPVQRELRPLIAPTLTFMLAWRTAKRLRKGPARGQNRASVVELQPASPAKGVDP
jgi:tetraprenyl-beta-curcumene synthase